MNINYGVLQYCHGVLQCKYLTLSVFFNLYVFIYPINYYFFLQRTTNFISINTSCKYNLFLYNTKENKLKINGDNLFEIL